MHIHCGTADTRDLCFIVIMCFFPWVNLLLILSSHNWALLKIEKKKKEKKKIIQTQLVRNLKVLIKKMLTQMLWEFMSDSLLCRLGFLDSVSVGLNSPHFRSLQCSCPNHSGLSSVWIEKKKTKRPFQRSVHVRFFRQLCCSNCL